MPKLTRRRIRYAGGRTTLLSAARILGQRFGGGGYGGSRRRSSAFSNRAKKGIRSGLGVTVQHDARKMYRRKAMPYQRRKRWRRFVKRVQFVNEKDMGTRTVLFNDSIFSGSDVAGKQGVLTLALYPQKGGSYLNDLVTISACENVGNPTAAAGSTVNTTSHIYFQSGVLDVTIRNVSTYNTGSIKTLAPEAQLELDIYEIYCRQDFATVGALYANLGNAIENEGNQELGLNGVTGADLVSIGNRGTTPWDEPTALSRLGLKILKKTKYFIPNSGTITYQMRDPGRKTCLMRELADENGANKPKWTKWILLIWKLVPGVPKGSTTGYYQENIQVGVSRKYMYKIEGIPENRNRYFTSTTTLSNVVA